MRISDWSSDVCSSDLGPGEPARHRQLGEGHDVGVAEARHLDAGGIELLPRLLVGRLDLRMVVQRVDAYLVLEKRLHGRRQRLPGRQDRKSTRLNSSH